MKNKATHQQITDSYHVTQEMEIIAKAIIALDNKLGDEITFGAGASNKGYMLDKLQSLNKKMKDLTARIKFLSK